MTEEQKSSETSASETDWEAPRQNKAVDTSNATSNESHQANTAESVEETAEGTQPAYGKNPNTAAARHTGVIRQTPTTKFCPKCGASLREGMPFCGTCGAKVGSAASAPTETKKKSSDKLKAIAGIAATAVVIVLIAIFAIPALTISPQELIAQGDFERAYSKASDDQKQDVLVANLAAVVSNDLIDNLKDSDSYELKNIYFGEDAHEMILEVSANNSFGGRVSNWYDYRFEEDDNEYQFYLSVGDLEDETIYKYADTFSEKLEKALKNDTRKEMRKIIADDDTKIPGDYVDGINELHETDAKFKNAKLISSINSIYPSDATA